MQRALAGFFFATPIVVAAPFVAAAYSTDFFFAGIPFGIGIDQYRTQMVAKGYTDSGWSDDKHYYNFDGKIGDQSVTMAAYVATGNKVEKFVVFFENDKMQTKAVRSKTKATLIEKYGPPVRDNEEDQVTDWGPDDGGLRLKVGDDGGVVLSYESPAWGKYIDSKSTGGSAKDL